MRACVPCLGEEEGTDGVSMARLIGLEAISSSLKAGLTSSLRVCDEAVVLPSATRSPESGSYKNVVMKLSGTDAGLNPDVFSSSWFAGVSALRVPNHVADALLCDPKKRSVALKKLAASIPSENADADLSAGPALEADESDRDVKPWTAGFDGSGCSVGLYCTSQLMSPVADVQGMSREHKVFFLVAKAGGGVAAQVFHARLAAALRDGKTLDQALLAGDAPGPQALRRVQKAARRNRTRLLSQAAEQLGFFTIDSVPDEASSPAQAARCAITDLDCSYNSLRKLEGAARSTWLYASGCCDTSLCQGLVTSSNLAEGFIAFATSEGSFKVGLRNDAVSCFPFCTPRLKSTRDLATLTAEQTKKARAAGVAAHPDHAWLRDRFAWKNKKLAHDVDLEPPALWGSHSSEAFLASWGRELGVAALQPLRLRPCLVCISSLEPGKLRTAARYVIQQ